jgi:hypothetical protein
MPAFVANLLGRCARHFVSRPNELPRPSRFLMNDRIQPADHQLDRRRSFGAFPARELDARRKARQLRCGSVR